MTKIQKRINREDAIDILRRYKETYSDKYNIIKLGLFGSLASGMANDKSDVDVVVELSKPDLFVLIGIRQELEERFKRHVDIVRYREKMNPFLKRRIEKEALYV